MDIYEKEKVLMNLRAELPRFKEEELVEYTKSVIPDIYRFLCHGESDKITKYCCDEIIQKMLLNKDSYRISQNMDSAKKELGLVIKRIISCVLLLLMPTIVSVLLSLLGTLGLEAAECMSTLQKIDLDSITIPE